MLACLRINQTNRSPSTVIFLAPFLGIDICLKSCGDSHNGMLIKVWLKTEPLQQWIVGREFRYRVRKAFEENNINIGKPQWIAYNTTLENDRSQHK